MGRAGSLPSRGCGPWAGLQEGRPGVGWPTPSGLAWPTPPGPGGPRSAPGPAALRDTDSRTIENFYGGVNISGVGCQVPVPGLLGAFPGLHLDNGQAAIKILFHHLLGQGRMCRGRVINSNVAHGILLWANLSRGNNPELLLVRSNFHATSPTKTCAWNRPAIKMNYKINKASYKIKPFLPSKFD
jgi:hypothetical protein